MICKRHGVWLVTMFMLAPLHGGVHAQPAARLCDNTMKPGLSRMVLHWDQFNTYGNVRRVFTEKDFAQMGEGAACRISSVREPGKSSTRPCHWTPRLSCDLEQGQAAASHSFTSGTVLQRGTLQWTGNQALAVSIKRGEVTAQENREVAVVRFVGRWLRGSDSGESTSTAYFDREWGVLLRLEGANDANTFGDTVTLVETLP
ncbi:MAG: hypothetical protein V4794_01790 [Pseudomonadota bacterium]